MAVMGVTVSTATALVTEPPQAVMMTRTCVPLAARVKFEMARLDAVAPVTSTLFVCHW